MAETLLRIDGAWVAVGSVESPDDPGTPPAGGPVPKPTVATTGPRTTVTGSTLSSTAAKNLAAANGGIVQGRSIANLVLNSPADAAIKFIDCDITGYWFGVEAWNGFGTPPTDPAARTTFEHCIIHDCPGNSGIAGRNVTVRWSEFTRNGDDLKPASNVEVYASLLHDLWAAGADPHGDNIQCFGGNDILFHWNTIDGRNSPDAPTQPGGVASSALQMSWGGDATNVRFLDNWVNGGAYTLRGADSWGGRVAQLQFRRNKHGRNYGFGPITGMGSYNGGLAVSDYDSSNVWEDTGLPVLG
jgi:hypothetical protein